MKTIVKQWEERNPEKVKEKNKKRSRKRIRTESERIADRKRLKQWKKDNPEKVRNQKRTRKKRLKKECPEKYNSRLLELKKKYKKAAKRNRRAKLKGAVGKHTQKQVNALEVKQRGACVNCLVSFKKTGYHVDHIIPLVAGGGNMIENIQLLCPECNRKKSAKDPIIFARENGRLV
jgi:5-methylcytosine-specific restriction endonuclease McrA